MSAARRQRNFEEKSSSRKRNKEVIFVFPTPQKSVRRLFLQVCHPYTELLRYQHDIFSLKTRLKGRQDKERQTDSFQSKVANHVNTKTMKKTK